MRRWGPPDRLGLLAGAAATLARIVWATSMRFSGLTRIRPPRGLSLSAIRKNETEIDERRFRS
jgi:hypothetical protein